MAAIVFWSAYARTFASLLVNAPSRKTGSENRLVVAIGTRRPVVWSADLNSRTGPHRLAERITARVANGPQAEGEVVFRPRRVGVLLGSVVHGASTPSRASVFRPRYSLVFCNSIISGIPG